MDKRLRKLRETYSARIEDNPISYPYWKMAKDQGRTDLMRKIERTAPSFVLVAQLANGEVKHMVDPQYGYSSDGEAMRNMKKLLNYPGWKDTVRVDMLVKFGGMIADRRTVYNGQKT
jgi:hypothetical protein